MSFAKLLATRCMKLTAVLPLKFLIVFSHLYIYFMQMVINFVFYFTSAHWNSYNLIAYFHSISCTLCDKFQYEHLLTYCEWRYFQCSAQTILILLMEYLQWLGKWLGGVLVIIKWWWYILLSTAWSSELVRTCLGIGRPRG